MADRIRALAALAALLAACSGGPGEGGPDASEPLDAAAADSGGPACPAGQRLQRDLTCAEAGWHACPEGFEAEPSGWGCLDVQPDQDCAAGTMPVLGGRTCQPVGWTECSAGFEPDPSGWGCREVLPATACQGATLEVLGQPACQPLGDCGAAFPPADATHFVDAAFSDVQVDATHFRTISEALLAAPAGSVIAVEAGTYVERIAVTVPVTIVGRCASQVIVDGSQTRKTGILDRGVAGVKVRGLTLRNHVFGVSVSQGGSLSLEESLLEANSTFGVYACDAQSAVTLARVAVRGTVASATGTDGAGLHVVLGARADVQDVVLQANRGVGFLVGGSGTDGTSAQIQAAGLVVRETAFTTSTGTSAAVVVQGGRLTLDRAALLANPTTGLYVDGAGSAATVSHAIVRGTAWDGQQALGAVAQGGAVLAMESCGLLGNEGGALLSDGAGSQASLSRSMVSGAPCGQGVSSGLSASAGALLSADGVAVVGAAGHGMLAVDGSELRASRVLVRESQACQEMANAVACENSTLSLEAGALVANQGFGLNVLAGCTATVADSVVRDTAEVAWGGAGIMVEPQGTLTLSRSALVANAAVGLQVGYHDGLAASATAGDLVVRQTASNAQGRAGVGLAVFESHFELDRALLLEGHEIGVWLGTNSDTRLSQVVVLRTLANAASRFGLGIAGDRIAGLALEDSAVVEGRVAGLFLSGGGEASVARTLIRGIVPETDGRLGSSLALVGAAQARLEESELSGSAMGLVVDASSLAVAGAVLRGNGVALQVQHGSTLSEVEEAPAAPQPLTVEVDLQTVLLDNGVKLGGGTVPLPELPF